MASPSLYLFFFFLISLSLSLSLPTNQSTDDDLLVVLTIHKDPKTRKADYFIAVKSIKIDEKPVPLNASSWLSLDEETGRGGTKLLNDEPYSILHSHIYEPFAEAFARSAARRSVARAAPVAPFGVCFAAGPEGSGAPVVELELEGSGGRSVFWRLFAEASVARVSEAVWCLGFLDGGLEARHSIVIGGLQLKYGPNLPFDVTKYVSKS